MNTLEELVRALAKRYCFMEGKRYLSHERYVSGWGDKRSDQLCIAVEDGTGRYEIRTSTKEVVNKCFDID